MMGEDQGGVVSGREPPVCIPCIGRVIKRQRGPQTAVEGYKGIGRPARRGPQYRPIAFAERRGQNIVLIPTKELIEKQWLQARAAVLMVGRRSAFYDRWQTIRTWDMESPRPYFLLQRRWIWKRGRIRTQYRGMDENGQVTGWAASGIIDLGVFP